MNKIVTIKHYISLCCFLLLLISCKENPTEEKKESNSTKISSVIENAQKAEEEVLTNPLQITKGEKALYKALEKKTPLTNNQLFEVLPKDINGNKPINEWALQVSSQLTSGMYDEPMDKKSYNFFIQDGVGSSAIIRNFFLTAIK